MTNERADAAAVERLARIACQTMHECLPLSDHWEEWPELLPHQQQWWLAVGRAMYAEQQAAQREQAAEIMVLRAALEEADTRLYRDHVLFTNARFPDLRMPDWRIEAYQVDDVRGYVRAALKTTPAPGGAAACHHEGIGLPGCLTCDPRTVSEGGPRPDKPGGVAAAGAQHDPATCPYYPAGRGCTECATTATPEEGR